MAQIIEISNIAYEARDQAHNEMALLKVTLLLPPLRSFCGFSVDIAACAALPFVKPEAVVWDARVGLRGVKHAQA